jgi:hypothetical protein
MIENVLHIGYCLNITSKFFQICGSKKNNLAVIKTLINAVLSDDVAKKNAQKRKNL